METENLHVQEKVVKEVSYPLFSSKGWIKLLGVLMLVYCILAALTIVGLLIAWLPIWLGVMLLRVSSGVESAQINGNKESLLKAMNNLSTFFTIYGVLALVGIVLWVLVLVVFFATGLFFELPEMIPDYY